MEQTYRQRTAQDHKAELDQILSSYKVSKVIKENLKIYDLHHVYMRMWCLYKLILQC